MNEVATRELVKKKKRKSTETLCEYENWKDDMSVGQRRGLMHWGFVQIIDNCHRNKQGSKVITLCWEK